MSTHRYFWLITQTMNYTELILINIINNMGPSVEDLSAYESSPINSAGHILVSTVGTKCEQCIPPHGTHLRTLTREILAGRLHSGIHVGDR